MMAHKIPTSKNSVARQQQITTSALFLCIFLSCQQTQARLRGREDHRMLEPRFNEFGECFFPLSSGDIVTDAFFCKHLTPPANPQPRPEFISDATGFFRYDITNRVCEVLSGGLRDGFRRKTFYALPPVSIFLTIPHHLPHPPQQRNLQHKLLLALSQFRLSFTIATQPRNRKFWPLRPWRQQR